MSWENFTLTLDQAHALIVIAFVVFMAVFGWALYRVGVWFVERSARKATDELMSGLMTPPEDCADVCTERKPARLKALR